VARCTGLTYYQPPSVAAGRGATYVACNWVQANCPSGQSCPGRPNLLQLAPAADCLAKGNPVPLQDPCWVYSTISAPLPAAGAPVVDPATRKVYLMTSGRILAGELGASSRTPLRALADHIAFSRKGRSTASALMSLGERGYLYAVNGDHVHRLEPSRSARSQRLGKEMKLSELKEEAWLLAPSPDGSLLSVIKRRGGGIHSLMSLCLKRCAGCLCQ
jgi:hypothetical protein